MFWWPTQDKQMTYWKIIPMEVQEQALSSSKTVSDRNYEGLLQHCQKLEKQNQELKNLVNSLQRKVKSTRMRKIKRRPENELIKSFQCLYPNCKKEYASSLALNLHMKIKHNAGSKRDRIIIANQIIRAQAQGREQPQVPINLPPNYLQTLKSQKKLKGANLKKTQKKIKEGQNQQKES